MYKNNTRKNNGCEKVYTEKVYSKFKLMTGNRWIRDNKVKRIVNSMRKFGWVGAPVIIKRNWEVVDGQHRIKAAEIAGIPVKYMFEDSNIDIKAVRELNQTQTSWREIDYIKSEADLGNASCQNYMALHNKYVNKKGNVITNTTITSIITGKVREHGFMNGTFDFDLDAFERCDKKLEILEKCAYALKRNKVSGRIDYFLAAISFMLDKGIDGEKLVKKIEKYPQPVMPAGNVRLALAQMETVYNFRNTHKVFFVSDWDMQESLKKQELQRIKDEKRAAKKKEV